MPSDPRGVVGRDEFGRYAFQMAEVYGGNATDCPRLAVAAASFNHRGRDGAIDGSAETGWSSAGHPAANYGEWVAFWFETAQANTLRMLPWAPVGGATCVPQSRRTREIVREHEGPRSIPSDSDRYSHSARVATNLQRRTGPGFMRAQRTYVPAAGLHWLLPIYDPYVRLLGWDTIRRTLLEEMDLGLAQRLLDIGCGTGSLAVLAKQLHPDVAVCGLDPDPAALARAARKARRAAVEVRFARGFSDRLPYGDASFDHVALTGVFNLLTRRGKEATLREVRRVLKPGGWLHVLDLLRSPRGGVLWRGLLGRGSGQRGHEFEVSSEDQVLALMLEAGFSDAAKSGQHSFWFWPIARYRARR